MQQMIKNDKICTNFVKKGSGTGPQNGSKLLSFLDHLWNPRGALHNATSDSANDPNVGSDNGQKFTLK